MTDSAKIRAYMREQAKHVTCADIAEATDLPGHAVSIALGVMKRAGIVGSDGKWRGNFTLLREPRPHTTRDPEAAARRQAEVDEARRVQKVNQSAKAAARQRQRLAVQANKALPKPKPTGRAVYRAARQMQPIRSTTPITPPKPTKPAASTAAFIAAGGDYEVLPNGASANPLRSIGFRGFTSKGSRAA